MLAYSTKKEHDGVFFNNFKQTFESRRSNALFAVQGLEINEESIRISKLSLETLEYVAKHVPFHYESHQIHRTSDKKSIAPFRVKFFHVDECRNLAETLIKQKIGGNGFPRLLNAANSMALIHATYDPVFATPKVKEKSVSEKYESNQINSKINRRNIEHTSSASILAYAYTLALTDQGINNYWSSAGTFPQTEEFYEFFKIEQHTHKRFIGCMFTFPREEKLSEKMKSLIVKSKSQGAKRGQISKEDSNQWCEISVKTN